MLRNRDFLSGLGLIILSAILFQQTLGGGIILFEEDIDPMLYPRVITVLLGCIGLIVCIKGLLGSIPRDDIPIFTRRTAGISLVLVIYAMVFNYIGFAISSFCAGCAIAWIMGWRRPLSLVLVNIAAVGVLWLLFVKGLRIPLPLGTLF